MAPVTRYARSGEASIAYQTIGDGKLDLLFTNGWISQVEQLWESPALRRMFERMPVFSRLILLDRRGTGLSDGAGEPYSLSRRRATRSPCSTPSAASARRSSPTASADRSALLLAAEHRERIGALIMYASVTRTTWAPDYDWAMTAEDRAAWTEQTVASWGEVGGPAMPVLAPSAGDDPSLAVLVRAAAAARREPHAGARAARTPARARRPRAACRAFAVPTLVMHRAGDEAWDPRHSRYIAQRIAGAHYVELDGVDSLPFVGDSGAIVEEIEEFLTGARSAGEVTRALLTVDLHRHRRFDRARRRARRRALARPARAPRRGAAQGAAPLRRRGGQDHRRRLPRYVRRAALASAALRDRDRRRRRASSASSCASACTPASAS